MGRSISKPVGRSARIAILSALLVAGAVEAGPLVEVTVQGTVEFNGITAPPLGDADPGEPITVHFVVDAAKFTDSPSFPTRGYEIDKSTFSISFPSSSIGLQSPFPGGQKPYFVLRNNDPAVDGFLISTSYDFPLGVPLNQTGVFGKFVHNWYVTYDGTTLPSLDILDALGVYTFDGLTVFNWSVEDGPAQPMGVLFEQLEIALSGAPGEASPPALAADQMKAAWLPAVQRIEVHYTPACDASSHTIYYGPLDDVSSYGYSGARCSIGTSGSAQFVPPAGSLFFLVVGTDGTREGSYGHDGDGTERPEAVGVGLCDVPQDLDAVTCR